MPRKTKILIVDDEYMFCKSLKAFLEKHGYQVSFTTNGEQALDLIKEEPPDLMTLDIRMPGLNGYEVLQKAKWISETMKIIVISAIDVPNMVDSLKRQGAHEVLNKPADLEQLLESIRELTTGKKAS
ncbi:MAG: response regulator [Nitrospinales bacterium]